jgi:hypothetical protein
MPSNVNETVQRRATYVALSSLFASLFTVFSLYEQRKNKPDEFEPFDLAMLGLASYRLGRMVSYDKVFEAERAPFTVTVPDPTGAGESVMPRGGGVRLAIGELICCPICVGTWISAILVFGLGVLPGPTRTFLKIMSGIGLAEFVNAATEALQWHGEAARVEAGAGRRRCEVSELERE